MSPRATFNTRSAIIAGRGFDDRDRRDSPRVCNVNEAFARSLGGRSPIAMQVSFKIAGSPQDKPNVGEIVRVAKQVTHRPDEPQDFVQIDVPLPHEMSDDVIMLVRSRTPRCASSSSAWCWGWRWRRSSAVCSRPCCSASNRSTR